MIYETCLVAKFQDSIGEILRRCNRNGTLITKELVLAEALTTNDTLLLENNGITEDLKAIEFASFISRAENALSQATPTNATNEVERRGGEFYKNQ